MTICGKSKMYLDASAIVSVLAGEDDADKLAKQLESATKPLYVSPLTIFEAIAGFAKTKAEPNKPVMPEMLEYSRAAITTLLERLNVNEVAITAGIGRKAQEAMFVYGKLVAHPARLNMGDCFAYACAKAYHVPMWYKGNDFALTDIE